MTIAAKISSSEITSEVTNRFVDGYFELILLNAPGVVYDESQGDAYDALFISNNECVNGFGGYARQAIGYSSANVGAYTDDGVALTTKAVIFEHDGSVDSYQFTHLVMAWGTGNVQTIGAATLAPAPVSTGLIENNVPVETLTGSGSGLKVRIETFGTAASAGSWGITVDAPGVGYANGDTLRITESTLSALGLVAGGAGDLEFPVSTVFNDANRSGKIFSVSQMANPVTLANGEEAGFYLDLKLFGFYS